MIRTFFLSEEGQSLTEYSLILALVALAAISGLMIFHEKLSNMYDHIKVSILGGLGG